MSADPTLILQMRRLGDLVLSFPLLLDLAARNPESPLWIAAEPAFFEQLMPLAPGAVFFPPSHLPQLAKGTYTAVINLSSQPEAAVCAGQAKAPLKLGPLQTDALRISGFWQLYRASLTRNNRHNLFHWADLNRLDLGYPLTTIRPAKNPPPNSGCIGLFVGASEASKRPGPEFWARLATRLARAGLKPILLGGPAETGMGAAIAAQSRLPLPNFCGKTSLAQLASILKSLDLLITPDTGPMHLADWLGVPALNLSMGNVQPWETGPASPGQWIVQAGISCAGCWACHKGRPRCREKFSPALIAGLAVKITAGHEPVRTPGLRLWQSGRQAGGLYNLVPRSGVADLSLDYFLQRLFLFFNDPQEKPALLMARDTLASSRPELMPKMAAATEKALARLLKSRHSDLPADFWRQQPRHFALVAGFTQMFLQNADFSASAWQAAASRLAYLRDILSG